MDLEQSLIGQPEHFFESEAVSVIQFNSPQQHLLLTAISYGQIDSIVVESESDA